MRTQLENIYRESIYLVDTPALCISVGSYHSELDLFLQSEGVSSWAFVTAHNPQSRVLSAEENGARHEALRHTVAERGLRFCHGRGMSQDGTWVEESLLLLGISQADALELGRTWGQHAVLFGELLGPAVLLWC